MTKKGKMGQLTSTTQPVDAGKSCSPLAKMSENEEIYTAGKNFTLPPAVTGVTKSPLQSPKPNTFSESWMSPGCLRIPLVLALKSFPVENFRLRGVDKEYQTISLTSIYRNWHQHIMFVSRAEQTASNSLKE